MRLQKNKVAAFTLIEILAVSIFLSIIGVYTFSYLRTTLKTQRTIDEKTTVQQNGIAVLSRLSDDVGQIFFVESYQKLTFFKGEKNKISFTSLSHDSANLEDRESDQAKITYALEPDSNSQNSTQILTRKEVPYFTGPDQKDDAYLPVSVARGVESLEFTYSDDGKRFVEEWDALSMDHLNKLPKMVKIILTIKDEKDREEYFETLITLPMIDDINTVTASATGASTGTSATSRTGSAKPSLATPAAKPTTGTPSATPPP